MKAQRSQCCVVIPLPDSRWCFLLHHLLPDVSITMQPLACSQFAQHAALTMTKAFATIGDAVAEHKQSLWGGASSAAAHWWDSDDPLLPCLLVLFAAIFGCWLLSLATNNCSQVDRLWSVLPILYMSIMAMPQLSSVVSAVIGIAPRNGHSNPRLLLEWLLVLLWGARLTFNFARKGGYRLSFEDYRWPIIRQSLIPNPFLFQIFNLVFIAIIQNVLLLSLLGPAYASWLHREQPLSTWDAVAATAFLFFLTMEFIADEQQWRFHQAKRRLTANGHASSMNGHVQQAWNGDVHRGFLSSGLWKYSRHPNFFCEQMIWWTFSLFNLPCMNGHYCLWFALPPAALTALFIGSTCFTEQLSAHKYMAYKEYQRTTSMLIPWFPKPASWLKVKEV